MKLLLQRTHANGHATFGKLFADGVFLCYTLEDVVREVAGTPVQDWKLFGKTAIPSTAYAGKPYVVTLENSGRFGPDTLTINAVPGFTSIRMHAGNTDADIKAMRALMEQAKGGWRTLAMLGGISATVGAGVVWLAQHLSMVPIK